VEALVNLSLGNGGSYLEVGFRRSGSRLPALEIHFSGILPYIFHNPRWLNFRVADDPGSSRLPPLSAVRTRWPRCS
jgi:hypothetical protein